MMHRQQHLAKHSNYRSLHAFLIRTERTSIVAATTTTTTAAAAHQNLYFHQHSPFAA